MAKEIDTFYTGDDIEIGFELFLDGGNWNLTNYQIRFMCWLEGREDVVIKKATDNIFGGSQEQILFEDASLGKFIVMISNSESVSMPAGTYSYEVEITSPQNKKTTVKVDRFSLKESKITWNDL